MNLEELVMTKAELCYQMHPNDADSATRLYDKNYLMYQTYASNGEYLGIMVDPSRSFPLDDVVKYRKMIKESVSEAVVQGMFKGGYVV